MQKLLIIAPFLIASLSFAQGGPEVVMTTGHNNQVSEMIVSDDGRFLVAADNNKIIKVWEIATTQEYRTISGTAGRVDQLAFSQDNIHVAGTTTNGELNVWNVLSGDEVFEGDCLGSSRGLGFFDSGKKLAFVNNDGHPSVLNIENGKIQEINVFCLSMHVDRAKGIGYNLDQLGALIKIDLKTATIIKSYQLFPKMKIPFSKGDITNHGKYIVWGFNDDIIRVFDTEEEKMIFESPKFATKIVTAHFDQHKPLLYVSTHDGVVHVYDYLKKKLITTFKENIFNTQCLTDHPNADIIILANYTLIRFYDVKRKKFIKELGPRVYPIDNMAYDQQGQYLAVAAIKSGMKIQIWDLALNKIVRNIQAFFPCRFTPDGKYLIASTAGTDLGVFDMANGELVKKLSTNFQLMQEISISPDGSKVAGTGFMQEVILWDFETTQLITTMTGHTAGIIGLDFHPTKPWLATGSLDETVRIWDYEKKKEIQQFTDQTIAIQGVKFSPDGGYLATSGWDSSVVIRNTTDWQIKHDLKGHVNMVTSVDWNKEGTVLVSGAGNNSVWEADNSLIFWNVQTGQQICRIKDHDAEIIKVIFDREANLVFSASIDGTVKLNDYENCEVVATYLAVGGKEFMIYTPDNYYMASRAALKGIAFRIDNQLVPFEQFDIYLNRPDIVAKRIGKSPDQLIKAYNYIYNKRLRKLNIDEGSLKIDYHLPKLINESDHALVTTNESIKLWVKAWDDVYEIKQFNVYVNDVPIFGEKGFRPSENVKSYRKEFEIPLLNGVNKVQLSCLNSNGAESLYETIEVIRDVDAKKHDLYIAAIGVSGYQDDRFKLKYPRKDATDIVEKLKESEQLYNVIHTKLLLDEAATTDGFKSLAGFFQPCTHEDIAIIFIAGHGVLNVDFDYFYGTYDMDFNNPDDKGLSYDDIHELLNRIKAYRKLLIMDTCHSGELDKEEIERDYGPSPEIEDGNIDFRAAGAGVRQKEAFGFENSLELMQDIFSDTRKGSGATVISSAGGAEYAMESDEWKNGLFTYTFLKGLTTFAANMNSDNFIKVSEIRAYVNQQVKELSGGNQIPSSREENISQDYIIFGR
ncbi:caspase family protein [Crocinitomix catalasitica]|nr:caspase family protein [Crocinitomix catalasitica]